VSAVVEESILEGVMLDEVERMAKASPDFARVANDWMRSAVPGTERSKMKTMTTKKPTKNREAREDFNQAAFRIVQQATKEKTPAVTKKRSR
jgi:hypothetical protein